MFKRMSTNPDFRPMDTWSPEKAFKVSCDGMLPFHRNVNIAQPDSSLCNQRNIGANNIDVYSYIDTGQSALQRV